MNFKKLLSLAFGLLVIAIRWAIFYCALLLLYVFYLEMHVWFVTGLFTMSLHELMVLSVVVTLDDDYSAAFELIASLALLIAIVWTKIRRRKYSPLTC